VSLIAETLLESGARPGGLNADRRRSNTERLGRVGGAEADEINEHDGRTLTTRETAEDPHDVGA
jgi:hypothetical protein